MPDNQDNEIQLGRSYLAHFNTYPWCSSILNAPDTTILHQLQRGGLQGDAFWRQTLRNQDTIRGAVHVISNNLAPQYPRIESSITLYSLGAAVAGHAGVCHGGLISTLFDEAMGSYIGLIEHLEAQVNEEYIPREVYTLTNEVSYKKAVSVPGVVLVRPRISLVEGKKRVVTATLEDEKGNVLSEAKGVFLALGRGKITGWYAKL